MTEQEQRYVSGLENRVTALQSEVAAKSATIASLQARLDEVAPAAGRAIPVAEFQRRLAPAYLAVPMLTDERIRDRWRGVLTQLVPSFTSVDLDDPQLRGMLHLAVADGVLSEDDVKRITA